MSIALDKHYFETCDSIEGDDYESDRHNGDGYENNGHNGGGDAQPESFEVDTDQKAEWALRRIANKDREYRRYEDICLRQIEFYEERISAAKDAWERDRSYLLLLLSQYFNNVPSKTTKTRSTYQLPSSKLVKRLEQQKLKHDPGILTEALRGTEFVELKPTLKWGEYKKTLTIAGDSVVDGSGEIVDGVEIVTEPEAFDVEVLM